MTTVVCGPMRCGKTRNAGHLLLMFHALSVVDDWDSKLHKLSKGSVHLTTDSPDTVRNHINPDADNVDDVEIVAFADLTLPSGDRPVPLGRWETPRTRAAARFATHRRRERIGI